MNKYAKIFFFIPLLYITTSPVLAENFYGAIDTGKTIAKNACYSDGIPGSLNLTGCTESAFLFRLNGGYQFSPMWGAEISYGDYGKGSLGTATLPEYGRINLGHWQFSGYEISGIATLPFSNAFSVIGKIGIAQTTIKFTRVPITATNTNIAYGIGAQYALSNCTALRAQLENLGIVGDDHTGKVKVILLTAGIVSWY